MVYDWAKDDWGVDLGGVPSVHLEAEEDIGSCLQSKV